MNINNKDSSGIAGAPSQPISFRGQIGANSAAVTQAEVDALMQSHYGSLVGGMNPFAAAAGFGMGASTSTNNSLILQHELLRRQEIERNLSAASAMNGMSFHNPNHDSELEILSRREDELVRLRNAHSQLMKAELVARSARDQMFGSGYDLPIAATAIGGVRGLRPVGLQEMVTSELPTNHQRLIHAPTTSAQFNQTSNDPIQPAHLSADERDRLSEVANKAYRNVLEAKGLSAQGAYGHTHNIGEKDLATEVELHDSVQRRLMEQEAFAELQKKQAARNESRSQASLALERVELLRRQQQQELLRLMQMQQWQMPNDDLLTLQPGNHGSIPMPFSTHFPLGALAPAPNYLQPGYHVTRSIDPQVALANLEKAYGAEGTPENDIISKFLNVVTSRVPEIIDMLAYLLPIGLVDNPEKFRTDFPRLVDATLAELKLMQDRASKENGYKSRGLYDRVTNCIAAINPYTSDLTNLLSVGIQSAQQDGHNPNLSDRKQAAPARPAAKLKKESLTARSIDEKDVKPPRKADSWECHKCGNENMSNKARCSSCQGWKGGIRDTKPKKKRAVSTEEPAEKTSKKNKKVISSEKNEKRPAEEKPAASPTRPNHILIKNQKPSKKFKKSTKERHELNTIDEKEKGTEDNGGERITSNGDTNKSNNVGGVDHMAANVLLGLMGGSSTHSEESVSSSPRP